MHILIHTAAIFITAWVSHFLLWKIRLPKRHVQTLLVIFTLIFLAWLGCALVRHCGLFFILHVALYYWAVSLCYTITYTAVEGDSPTLSLMRFVAASGSSGRSMEEIVSFMAVRPFIGARLAALIASGLIREQDNRYVLAREQPLSFRMILGFRRIYGSIPKGG
jgi:hypothetical protein